MDAQLGTPTGVPVDAAGDIYVVETEAQRIRVIKPLGGIGHSTTFHPANRSKEFPP